MKKIAAILLGLSLIWAQAIFTAGAASSAAVKPCACPKVQNRRLLREGADPGFAATRRARAKLFANRGPVIARRARATGVGSPGRRR